jgi:hypothetical protein
MKASEIVDPRKLGLPHPTWRVNQFQAFKSTMALHESGGGFVFAELGTGSGKTGLATALSHYAPVTALVQNLGLLDQYHKLYGFDIVKGKPEYQCVLRPKCEAWYASTGKYPTCADCHFTNARNCPQYGKCPYYIARDIAMQSNKCALTYRYASLSEMAAKREGILVLDEAHLSGEEMLALTEFKLDTETRVRFDFPDFPLPLYGTNGDGDLLTEKDKMKIVNWFTECIQNVADVDLFDAMTPTAARNKRIVEQLRYGLDILLECKDIFYTCRIPPSTGWGYAPNALEMRIKPIDAKHVASKIWASKQTVLLMSATIGDPKPLAKELGIDKYHFFTYPHPVPSDYRPVYDLHNQPMTYDNLKKCPSLYRVQALLISNFIAQLNPEWRGIVLTNSNDKIKKLKGYLKERFPDRVFEQKKSKVADRLQNFIMDKTPGKILVETVEGFGHGIDLSYDIARFSVMAGVPFSNPTGHYEQARQARDGGKAYDFWRAYTSVPQAVGRVSRGEKEPDGNWMMNVGAIADGSGMTERAKASYPQWFLEGIRDF